MRVVILSGPSTEIGIAGPRGAGPDPLRGRRPVPRTGRHRLGGGRRRVGRCLGRGVRLPGVGASVRRPEQDRRVPAGRGPAHVWRLADFLGLGSGWSVGGAEGGCRIGTGLGQPQTSHGSLRADRGCSSHTAGLRNGSLANGDEAAPLPARVGRRSAPCGDPMDQSYGSPTHHARDPLGT